MQRRAASFVENEYSTTPGNVMIILNDLKWPTLEKRRSGTTHNDVSSQSAIQFPPYILFKRRQGIRQFHSKTFIQVGAKTSKIIKYQHSYVLLQVQSETGTSYKIVSLKSSRRGFRKDRHVPSLIRVSAVLGKDLLTFC